MKNSKRVIAGAMALLSAVSVASCGSSSGSDSSSSYVDKVKVASTDDIATIPDGSEKELEWLSYFDINPTKKEPEKRTDLTLFEEKGEACVNEWCYFPYQIVRRSSTRRITN